MTKIITENFKTETTRELYKSLEEENFYAVASTAVDVNTFTTSPNISNTQFSKREFQRKMIFGKKVDVATRSADTAGSTATNLARYMFLENAWEEGRVYDAYDDQKDIETLDMIVSVRQDGTGDYIVLKCIDNNNGAKSTDIVGATDTTNYQFFTGSDGYVWHTMFTVTAEDAILYRSPDSLPLPEFSTGYGDKEVVEDAEVSVSRIVIENTQESMFNQYLFGPANSINDASDVLCINPDASPSATIKDVVVSATVLSGRTLYTQPNAYKNMYLRDKNTGKLYDVIASKTSADTNQITLSVETSDTFVAQQIYQLVIKILVSQSEIGATRCRAYGKIDEFGTLKSIGFETRGTKYKFATAQVIYPPFLKGSTAVQNFPTVLRAIVSPKGGHGSNPINEMAMSKISIATMFSGDSDLVPDSNTYSVVGLLKNPVFRTSSGTIITPDEFDNRLILELDGDHHETVNAIASLTGGGKVNDFIRQFIAVESVQDIKDGQKLRIVDAGNMNASDWASIGAASPEVGTDFTASSTASLPSTKTGTVSRVRELQVTELPEYDYSIEMISAKIHDIVFNANTNKTEVYLVDYDGGFMHEFQLGEFFVSTDDPSKKSLPLTINTKTVTGVVEGKLRVADGTQDGSYEMYSGDVLHFIDFSPITRDADKNEKIKFTFDF